MASDELVERAMQTWKRLDTFGKRCTAHAFGTRSEDDLREAFAQQDDWTLEHITIEEMEFDLSSNTEAKPRRKAASA